MRKYAGTRVLMVLVMIGISTGLSALAEASETYYSDDFAYEVVDGNATIVRYMNISADIVLDVPDQIDNHPVTQIGDQAFMMCGRLTGITLPESLISIGNGAFRSCRGLTEIFIPENVIAIGYYPFRSCTALGRIDVAEGNPVYAAIDGMLIDTHEKILVAYPIALPDETCEIAQGILRIGENAFYGSENLAGIAIPGSVISVSKGAFDMCRGLRRIEVADENPVYASFDGVLYDTQQKVLLAYPAGLSDE